MTACKGWRRRRIASLMVVAGMLPGAGVALQPFDVAAAAPVIVSPANGSVVDAESVTLTVNADPGASVQFFGRRVGDTVPVSPGSDFTLVVIPDTQNYTWGGRGAMIGAQAQWIVDNRANLNVAMVSQVGDLVSEYDSNPQWQVVSNGLKVLDDAGVPNAVVPGNHDFNNTTGAFTQYNTFFPVSRYDDAGWNSATVNYGGWFGGNQVGPDSVDRRNMNNFTLFDAGGRQFLLLSLEWEAPDNVLEWANRVVDAYPNRIAILSTHAFININGNRSTVPERPGGNAPAAMWNELVFPNCNIRFVINGHYHNGNLSEARRTDNNSCGQPVPQILSDYQDRPNGGNGWLRYYTFKPSTNTVQASTYSPTLGTFETDADSSFTFPFDLAATQPAPFASLGTATATGGTATINWPNLTRDRQYEWYAVAGGGGAGDTSPVAQFSVAAPAQLLDDTFSRTVSNGWGTADTGQAWVALSGGSSFSVSGGMGRVNVPRGSTRVITAQGAFADASVLADLAIDTIPGGTTYLSVLGRTGGGDYRAKLQVTAAGATALHLVRYQNGTETTLASANVSGLTVGAGQRLRLRFEFQGASPTTLRARVWRATNAEPTTWNVTASDSAASLQGTGGTGFNAYLSSSATGTSVPISLDTFSVSRIGSTPPPTTTTTTTSTTTTSTTTTSTTMPPTTSSTTTSTSTTSSTTSTTTLTMPPVSMVSDSFTRTVANGWGTSTSGHTWSVAGTSSRYLVNGSAGQIRLSSPGTDATVSLNSGPTSTSTDLRFQLSFDKTGSTLYATAIPRYVSATTNYRVKVAIDTAGRIRLQLVRRVNNAETVLADAFLTGVTYQAGRVLTIAAQAVGTGPTTLRARVWVAGQAEPATWLVTATDSTAALQTAGRIGVNHYMSSSGGALAPLTLTIDNLVWLPA